MRRSHRKHSPLACSTASGSTRPHSEITIYKLVDAASPKLYEACCKGTHLPTATIEFCKTVKDRPVKFLSFTLKDVLISSVTADAKSESQFPSEVVSLDFGSIEWIYTKVKADGTPGDNVAAKWDVKKGTAA